MTRNGQRLGSKIYDNWSRTYDPRNDLWPTICFRVLFVCFFAYFLAKKTFIRRFFNAFLSNVKLLWQELNWESWILFEIQVSVWCFFKVGTTCPQCACLFCLEMQNLFISSAVLAAHAIRQEKEHLKLVKWVSDFFKDALLQNTFGP